MMEQNKRQTPSIIQIVPPEWCFKCDVCCRFPESTSFLAPYFTAEEIALSVEAGLSGHNFHKGTLAPPPLAPLLPPPAKMGEEFGRNLIAALPRGEGRLDEVSWGDGSKFIPPPLTGGGKGEGGQRSSSSETGCKITLTPGGEAYVCPAFDLPTAHCRIYNVRPFDCELYPYALMRDETGENVILGLDTKCPYVRENMGMDLFTAAARDIANAIESPLLIDIISENRDLIGPFQDDVISLTVLKKLTSSL